MNKGYVRMGALCCMALLTRWSALAVDADGDGISDIYLAHYGVAPVSADFDVDGDGATTAAESAFGTAPLDATSRPGLTVTGVPPQVRLGWQSVAGIIYQLQASNDLVNWSDDGSFVIGDGAPKEETRSAGLLRRFYRLSATHGPDEDGDGLDLYEELLLGTNPTLADSDGDGITDFDEIANNTDPNNPDTDNDGTSDGAEAARGTDPKDSGDGISQTRGVRTPKVRLAYMGTWPNYLTLDPPDLPAIDLTITDNATGQLVGSVDEAGAILIGASPQGIYSGYSSRGGTVDPILTPGKEYTMRLTFAGNIFWPDIYGRMFGLNLNPDGTPLHIIIYSTRTNGGSYYYSNSVGGIWHQSVWQASGSPTNTVANSVNFPLASSTTPTAALQVVLVDLDVDSDNNEGSGAPSQTNAEDILETTQAKFVPLNDDSDNGDATADYAQTQVDHENDLIPTVLTLGPQTLAWDKVKVKFSFPGNEIKLWAIETPSSIKDPTKQIQPNTEYTAAQLGFGAANGALRLFIEGIALSPADTRIEATFIHNGMDFGAKDAVLIRVVKNRIVLTAGQPDEIGGLIPSRLGVRGALHFVTPKSASGTVGFTAETNEPWSSSLYSLEVVNRDAATSIVGNTVSLSRAVPRHYTIQLKAATGGAVLAEQHVWVIWADKENIVPCGSIPSSITVKNNVVPNAFIKVFPFLLQPTELTVAGARPDETPNLGEPWMKAPPGEKKGADTRLDITQRFAVHHRNPSPTTLAFKDIFGWPPHGAKQIGIEWTYFPIADVHLIQFPTSTPTDVALGNDDPTTGDEDNNPYVTYEKNLYGYHARKGVIASSDRPNSPSIAATAGTPGETDTESIKFETFVRLNVGLISGKSQWLVISEPHQWMVIQKFERGNDRMHADNCEFHADHIGF